MDKVYNKELAPERRDHLMAMVQHQGSIRVEDAVPTLGVSPATVRRDLEILEDHGRLQRVHGGAVRIETCLAEPLFDDKTLIAPREKRGIAQKALTFIAEGDTVYLDGGSTVLELARKLRGRPDLTVVTNSLRSAIELGGAGPRLILVGGEFRRRSQTMIGSLTRYMLETIHLDKAFMGTMGFSLDEGLTTTDPNEAFTKELIMKRAEKIFLLADSSKAGKLSFAQAGRLEQVHHLITDSGLPQTMAKHVKKLGINLSTA